MKGLIHHYLAKSLEQSLMHSHKVCGDRYAKGFIGTAAHHLLGKTVYPMLRSAFLLGFVLTMLSTYIPRIYESYNPSPRTTIPTIDQGLDQEDKRGSARSDRILQYDHRKHRRSALPSVASLQVSWEHLVSPRDAYWIELPVSSPFEGSRLAARLNGVTARQGVQNQRAVEQSYEVGPE